MAARLAALEQERVRQEKWRVRVWRERRALLILLGFVLLCLPNFRLARVVGHSMEPELHDGELLLVLKSWRWFSPLRPGDIVVFHKEGQELVKRVVFVQNPRGTAFWPPQNRILPWRPQADVSSAYFPDYARRIDRILSGPGYRQRSVYVLGDNYGSSYDSRDFGPIEPESILGKVIRAH